MPANKKAVVKHNQQHYKRWAGMIQRCNNPNNRSYNERRSKGVKVDDVWAASNPDGLFNYAKWVDEQLALHPELAKGEFRVARIKSDVNYGPDNCHLLTHVDITRHRISSVMNVEVVVEMRRYKKANPHATLAEMETKFNFSQANISRSLRGVSWSNADELESPLPKQEKQECQNKAKKRNRKALVGTVL